MSTPHDLADSVAVIDPRLRAQVLPLSPDLYQTLDERFDNFRGHLLIARHDFDRDWPSWECHPKGDELVVLLQGAVDFVLRIDGEDTLQRLQQPGAFVVVPAGIWHTARIAGPSQLLFITPGEATGQGESPP